jgi:hypothetical protein
MWAAEAVKFGYKWLVGNGKTVKALNSGKIPGMAMPLWLSYTGISI